MLMKICITFLGLSPLILFLLCISSKGDIQATIRPPTMSTSCWLSMLSHFLYYFFHFLWPLLTESLHEKSNRYSHPPLLSIVRYYIAMPKSSSSIASLPPQISSRSPRKLPNYLLLSGEGWMKGEYESKAKNIS